MSRAIIRDLFDGAEAQALMAQAALLGGLDALVEAICSDRDCSA